MPFLGVQPTDTFASVAKQTLTAGISGTTVFTLNHGVSSSSDIALYINNVRQEPVTSYSASGITLTLTDPIFPSDDAYLIYIARTFQSVGMKGITDDTEDPILTINGSNTTGGNAILNVGQNQTMGYYVESENYGFEISNGGVGGNTVQIKNNGQTILSHNQIEDNLRLRTDGTDRVTIDASGSVGIGVTDVEGRLSVIGPASTYQEYLNVGHDTSSARLHFTPFSTVAQDRVYIAHNIYRDSSANFQNDKSGIGMSYVGFLSNGAIAFSTDGTASTTAPSERMRILESGGITFNGDTAAANALDDYEEGTWTPRFEALTTDFTTVTYIVQDGFYQKVGNTVHTWFRLRISAYTGSPAGLVVVAGWPFTPSAGVYQAGCVGYSTGWTNSPQNVYTQTNQGYAIMSKDGGAGTSGIQIGDLSASGFNDIIASVSYKV